MIAPPPSRTSGPNVSAAPAKAGQPGLLRSWSAAQRILLSRPVLWGVVAAACTAFGAGFWCLGVPIGKQDFVESAAATTLMDIGRSVRADIARVVHPAMERTRRLAVDRVVVDALRGEDAKVRTLACNSAIRASTEIDAFALFDRNGRIVAINTEYASGEPISAERIDRIMRMNFDDRDIVQKCIRNDSDEAQLEFQTTCDITPAFFDSSGLSVAFSVPVRDPVTGLKLGVASARLRFERVSDIVLERTGGDPNSSIEFITDHGEYFSEAIASGRVAPPVSVAALADLVVPLVSGAGEHSLTRHGTDVLSLFRLQNFATLEGGGIQVLLVANERWLTREVRQARALKAGGLIGGGVFLMLLASLMRGVRSLSDQRRLLRTILDLLPQRVFWKDRSGRYLGANKAMFTDSGTDDMVGKTDADMPWTPEQTAYYVSCDRRVMSTGEAELDIIETQRNAQGQATWLATNKVPLRDAAGAVIGVLGTYQDITDLKQTEADLRLLTERYELAVRGTREGLWDHNLDTGEVYYAPSFKLMLGYRTDDPDFPSVIESLMDRIHPDDLAETRAAIRQSLQEGSEYKATFRLRTQDGSWRWFEARGVSVLDDRGRAHRMAGMVSDITERRHAEAERERANRAEAANHAKSEFLAHMSHEIRTPLNGVVGLLDLLLGTELSADQRRYGKLAKNSASLLTSVIGDILDLSKIEAGRLEMSPSDFNLHDAVEEVMEMMAQPASRKKIETVCHIHPDVPVVVHADAERLRQIVVNLVNNAIKFTDQGAVVLRLSRESSAGPRTIIRFTVTDTGIGIPPDRLDRLFKAFSQADSSTTRVYGGTGLGLAISKQLVGLMGGSIGVESEPGRGSTFWFTCHFDVPVQYETPLKPRPDPRTLRVLAVDDSKTQRDVLRQQTAAWGIEAVTASGAEEALQMLADASTTAPFRLAIVDRDMPGMDGFELALAIRARRELRDTALLIVLSPEDAVDPERLRDMGFAGHMIKPIRQSQLFDTIMDTVAASGRVVSPRPAASPRPPSPSPDPVRFTGLRILVAEDNEVNQFVVREVLTKSGHRCDIVGDGKQAAETLQRDRYDVVLMDCQMPVMDGFEATRVIRRNEAGANGGARRHTPIVALTANAMKGDRERCLEAGMDGYASKPIDPKQLLQTIDQVIRNQIPAAQAA
jgi:PAS domain S-box-containing protein